MRTRRFIHIKTPMEAFGKAKKATNTVACAKLVAALHPPSTLMQVYPHCSDPLNFEYARALSSWIALTLSIEQDRTLQAQDRQAWRYMLPFFVLVGVFLLLVFRLLNSGPAPLHCGEGLKTHRISQMETCWQIAQDERTTVDKLTEVNDGLKCDHLVVGSEICVPGDKPT